MKDPGHVEVNALIARAQWENAEEALRRQETPAAGCCESCLADHLHRRADLALEHRRTDDALLWLSEAGPGLADAPGGAALGRSLILRAMGRHFRGENGAAIDHGLRQTLDETYRVVKASRDGALDDLVAAEARATPKPATRRGRVAKLLPGIRSQNERAVRPWRVHRVADGMTRIVVCSGEPSGDAMVQELLPALRALFGDGLQLRVLTSSPVDGLEEDEVLCPAPEPVLGVSMGGARRWRSVLESVWRILAADPPDLLIAIAHHGFNLVLAAELKALAGATTRTLMVAPPEVWAWDVRWWLRGVGRVLRWVAPRRQSVPFVLGAMADRGRSTLKLFDAVACLMEPNFQAYRRLDRKHEAGRLVVKVGHPFARYAEAAAQERVRDAARALRATLVSSPEDLLVGLFPGSREAEVDRLLPIILDATDRLRGRFGDRLKLVATASDERRAAQIRRVLDEHSRQSSVDSIPHVTGQAEAAVGAADFGLLCSGTVTLLAASLGLPSVVIYDRGWSLPRTLLTHLLLRRGRLSSERGAKPVGFALPSAVVGERVFPELSMRRCTPRGVAASLEEMIGDEGARERIRGHQQRLLGLLQPSPPRAGYGTTVDTPMQRAAQLALELVAKSAGRV